MDRYIKTSYRPILLLLALLNVSVFNVGFAQEQIIELDEVEVIASPIKKFGVGANIFTIDSSIILTYAQTSLAQLLNTQSSVYIKQYGAGMLSTVAFRGTGAGHTSILWNGMQVGYPFLGQTDLSLIPIDFTDEINLVHGSASARYGTGAIGGIIDLQSNNPQNGFGLEVNQSFGSFGTMNSAFRISNSGKKGYIEIGGIYKKSKNNFLYRSNSGEPLGNQENSDYSFYGVQLESKYHINSVSFFLLSIQGINADRNLQPSIGSTASNNQKDQNLWSSLVYSYKLKSGVLKGQYGRLFDQINYNGSVTYSRQNNARVTIEYDFKNNLSTEIGLNSNWVEVVTPFYENNVANENRSNLYASISWRATNRLNTSLNLRQAFVTGYNVPFTPSLGFEYHVATSNFWKLYFEAQLAKGYKVPTLNDRYWVPGGNLELESEESLNAEIGFKFKNTRNFPVWIGVTTYQLWVKNWILWLPQAGIWSPENKQKVKGTGVEVESGFEKKMGPAQLKGWLNYAFTKSTNMEPLDQYDRSEGKQLPYVPFHNGNITWQLSINKWEFQINGVVTGKRFITSDNENEVPGYVLLNTRVGYDFHFSKWRLLAYLEGNNITNTNYQSIINKAMPGINFLGGLKINFNNE